MPKITDLKQYYRELAQKAGLAEDAVKQVEALAENKAFVDGLKPLPDYSHDLDDVRNRAKAEKDQEYADWHAKELEKYNAYVAGLDRLKQYEARFGRLDVSNPPDPGNPSPGGHVLSQEDIDKLVETKLQAVLTARDQAFLSFRDADFDHMRRFSKPMDRVAFQKSWQEHPEWGGDLYNAYEKWITPEVDKMREAEWNTKMEQKYQEGLRDGFSRKAVPTDHQPKTFSPLFDRKEDVGKMSESDQDRHSREAFFTGLRGDK